MVQEAQKSNTKVKVNVFRGKEVNKTRGKINKPKGAEITELSGAEVNEPRGKVNEPRGAKVNKP